MGGLILSAMAAAGDSGAASIQGNIDQQNKLDMAQKMSDLEAAKAQTLATFNSKLAVDQANQLRTDRASNIEAKAATIAELRKQVAPEADAQADAAATAYGNAQMEGRISPDGAQQGLIAAAQYANSNMVASPVTDDDRMEAAKQLGYIDPKDVMSNTSKNDIAQMKMDNFADRTATLQKMTEMKGDFALQAAQLRVDAANERAANGKVSASTLTMLVTSENKNIDTSTRLIGTLSKQLPELTGDRNKGPRDAIQAQIEEYKADIAASKAAKNSYLAGLGLIAPPPAKEAPSAPSSAIPSGYTDTGKRTPDGKTVYTDGKKNYVLN